MKALLAVLITLNVVFASIGVPIFVAGVGLGSGGAGSSFKRPTNLDSKTLLAGSSDSAAQLKAANLIFQYSCEEEKWNSYANGDFGKLYPYHKKAEQLQKFIGNNDVIEALASKDGPCQPLKKGKSGIAFVGGNGVEMSLLLSNLWDRRILTSITYLIVKRFKVENPFTQKTAGTGLIADKALAATPAQNETGYGEECDHGSKSAPFLTLRVAAGYMNINGRPTGLARAGVEDDEEAIEKSDRVVIFIMMNEPADRV